MRKRSFYFSQLWVLNLYQGSIKGLKWKRSSTELNTNFSLTTTSVWQLLLGVCWEHFEFPFSTCVCGASLPRPGAPPSCSPPPPLDWVTCTLQLLRSPTPSLFLVLLRTPRLLDFRRQTLGDSKPWTVKTATFCFVLFLSLFTFLGFQREPRANTSHHQHGLLRNFHRAEKHKARMAGWCCSCCFGHTSQHPTHKATL